MSYGWNWPCPLPDGSDLLARLRNAEEEVRRLTERIGQLENRLAEIGARSPMHIEYHFDQLKVNELKGTLNVGLSPQGVQGIDSFEVPAENAAPWQVVTQTQPDGTAELIARLQRQMQDYMDREAPAVLGAMEREYGMPLGRNRLLQVLRDVKKQLNDRVHYYAKTAAYPSEGTEQERMNWRQTVLDKTTRDVNAAFSSYFEGLKAAEGMRGGSS